MVYSSVSVEGRSGGASRGEGAPERGGWVRLRMKDSVQIRILYSSSQGKS